MSPRPKAGTANYWLGRWHVTYRAKGQAPDHREPVHGTRARYRKCHLGTNGRACPECLEAERLYRRLHRATTR